MEKKNVVFLTVLAVATLLTAVVGTTFAYFTATVTGNEDAQETVITTARLGVTYNDGSALSTASLIIPGWSETKTISVTNTSNVDVTYSISWTNVTNGFVEDVNPADSTDSDYFFVYTVGVSQSTTGTSGMATINSGFVADATTSPVTLTEFDMPTTTAYLTHDQVIKPGETQEYAVTMKYKEAGYAQDSNQNKTFRSTVQVSVNDLGAVVAP